MEAKQFLLWFFLEFNCYIAEEYIISMHQDVYHKHNKVTVQKTSNDNVFSQINTVKHKQSVATANLQYFSELTEGKNFMKVHLKDDPYTEYIPGYKVPDFSLPTLDGEFIYSSSNRVEGRWGSGPDPVLFSVYNPYSGFQQCLWNCSGSLEDLVSHSPGNTRYVFISTGPDAFNDALWMKARFSVVVSKLMQLQNNRLEKTRIKSFLSQLNFVSIALSELGNWIPTVLKQWMCLDHNCGLSQVLFSSSNIKDLLKHPLILPRLDARYDWLPSPESTLKNPTYSATYVADSCSIKSPVDLKGKIALVNGGNCSYFTKVKNMQSLGAVCVLVMSSHGVKDMNCQGQECEEPLKIPAASIPYNSIIVSPVNVTVSFQTTPTDNFFMAIDPDGNLAEVGWFLYPTMHFLAWQAQWFNYKADLQQNLSRPAYVVSVYNRTVMQGETGAVASISLPEIEELRQYASVHLDTSLSCPGALDRDCPHWDHTVRLAVNCHNATSSEIGRWITAFRRRVGRWLTDVTHLLPLLEGSFCRFTMTTAPWAMAWLPSLSIRFSGSRKTGDIFPWKTLALYNGDSFTFNRTYNSHFKPVTFSVPSDVIKVEISATITGHGSDENGCGEFCNTSHHFVINKQHVNTRHFNISGTPLGCADRVPLGVTPNEHGTWLYGRDGWCDGQDVKPWLLDITAQLNPHGNSTNLIQYYGYFNGTDPNPKQNPGVMIISSYVVFYKQIL